MKTFKLSPQPPKSRVINFKVNPDTFDALQVISDKNQLNLSEVVRQMVAWALTHLDNEEGNAR